MIDHKNDVIEELCRVYADSPEIGLVLGAGVTKASGVQNWNGLALLLFEKAQKENLLRDAPEMAMAYLNDELEHWKRKRRSSCEFDPEKVLQFVWNNIEPREKIRELIKEALFIPHIKRRTHKMVAACTYRENKTLEAVITFCAAVKGSPIASEPGRQWGTNRKVGAILTTNYDNLVEGSFNSKYRLHLLRPVAREGEREGFGDQRIIPVYHMHGYVSYIDDLNSPGKVKASDQLVLTETDYYRTFHDLRGFGNTVAVSFFRRFQSIFIGCSLIDRNVRRILYQLQTEKTADWEPKRHFAILPCGVPQKDAFEDALLDSLGVASIRIDGGEDGERIGAEVEKILECVYLRAEGVSRKDWLEARKASMQRKQ